MKPIYWFSIYLLSVFIFSLIYYAAWRSSPDSFIVSTHLNSQPILELNDFLWRGGEYEIDLAKGISLYELKAKYDSYYADLVALETELDEITESQMQNEVRRADLSAAIDSNIGENIENYERTMLGPLLERERELEREVNYLERSLSSQANTNMNVELIRMLGDKRSELAEHRVERANLEYQTALYVVDNFSSFVSEDIYAKQSDLMEKEALAHDTYMQLEKDMRDIRLQAIEQIRKDTQHLVDRVGFIDFFYYSIGISTTTTFGDVTANRKMVRGIVSLQLLLCIILVSGLVDSVFVRR